MQWSRQRARSIRRIVAGVLVAGLLIALTIVVVQHRRDSARFKTAHAAYLAGRCDDAIADFDALLGSSRLADTTGSLGEAKLHRKECADLLEVDALAATDPPEALVGYVAFLADWPDTALHDAVVARAAALVADRGAAGVASTASCARLSDMTSASLLVEAKVTSIRLECATLYKDAGRTSDAYAAALSVLRSSADRALVDRAAALVADIPAVCDDLDEVRSLAKLDQRSSDLSALLQFCISTALGQSDPTAAARFRLALISALPADPAVPAAKAALLAGGEVCALVGDAQADPAIAAQTAFLADLTFWCAQVSEYVGDFASAVDAYQWFIDHVPLDPRVAAARDGLARSLIGRATGAGAGTLPTPQQTGKSGSATARVVVYNDSPEQLRLVLSGPQTRIETIPASATSHVYSLVGPVTCRTDVPSLVLQLPPGEYKALVEATGGGVEEFVGTWTLTKGAVYESCFYIVSSFK